MWFTGVSVGTALTMVSSGYLIEYFGWPAVFYGIGAFSIIWFIFWTFLVFDTPADHPRISPEEKNYIINTIGHQQSTVSLEEMKDPSSHIILTWFLD